MDGFDRSVTRSSSDRSYSNNIYVMIIIIMCALQTVLYDVYTENCSRRRPDGQYKESAASNCIPKRCTATSACGADFIIFFSTILLYIEGGMTTMIMTIIITVNTIICARMSLPLYCPITRIIVIVYIYIG